MMTQQMLATVGNMSVPAYNSEEDHEDKQDDNNDPMAQVQAACQGAVQT